MKKTMLILLINLMLITGCQTPAAPVHSHAVSSSETQTFQQLTRELFLETISSDTISLHYHLKNPQTYQLPSKNISFGRIACTDESMKTSQKKLFQQLKAINRLSLSEDDRQTYDILYADLLLGQQYADYDFSLYSDYLSENNGLHTMIPVLLNEFSFHHTGDVQIYLELLKDLPEYFNNIIKHQTERAKKGLFMSDRALQNVITSCQPFAQKTETHILITQFNEKINQMPLFTTVKKAWMKKNQQYVFQYVIPAYESLIKQLTALKGLGKEDAGLYYDTDGLAYYQYLVQTTTGTSYTIDEWIRRLDLQINQDILALTTLFLQYPNILSEELPQISIPESPEAILASLQSYMKDFPEPQSTSYEVKTVPEILQKDMNPAFYLLPPIDAPEENIIYINPYYTNDQLSLFTTLAHEGFPGHLYQNTYFIAHNTDPVRHVFSFPGYTEGWASYVEFLSYEWLELPQPIISYLQLQSRLNLCLHTRMDFGIHAQGWQLIDVYQFLSAHGITSKEIATSIFELIVSDPAASLPYCCGMLEFLSLREQFKTMPLSQFHDIILKTGPCNFEYLYKKIEGA